MYKTIKNKKGFTLVEMLVAVSILVVAIGAPLFVATQGITLATTAKNRLIASFLVQEGLEYIRNRRDSNVLQILAGNTGINWNDGFSSGSDCLYSGSGNSNKGCKVDIYANTIQKCQGAVNPQTDSRCEPLSYQVVGGEKRYGYGFSNNSPFTRTIRVYTAHNPGPPDRLDDYVVEVIVTWNEKGRQQTVTAQQHLMELQ